MYIKIEDVGIDGSPTFTYDAVQKLFPEKSLATIGDLVDEGYYRIDTNIQPNPGPFMVLDRTSYVLKALPDMFGSVEPIYHYRHDSVEVVAKILRKQVTTKRFEEEAAGITINGTPVNTSIEDQNRITSIIVNAPLAGIDVVRFTLGDNEPVTKTLDEVKQIAVVTARMVLAWTDTEAMHFDNIKAIVSQDKPEEEIFAELVAYDINSGWPDKNVILPSS